MEDRDEGRFEIKTKNQHPYKPISLIIYIKLNKKEGG